MPAELTYRKIPPDGKHMVFLDVDVDRGLAKKLDLSGEEAYGLVLFDVKLLQERFNLGRAEILATDSGNYMAKFPEARCTVKEMLLVMRNSITVDRGYYYWVEEKGMATLRISPKKIVELNGNFEKIETRTEGGKPKLIEVIR